MRYTANRVNIINGIYTVLKNIYSNVYFERVPQGTQLPYAVFDLGLISQLEGGKSSITLEINVWDNRGDNISDLENVTGNISEGLYKLICDFGGYTLRFENADINNIPDTDNNIRRRNISINVMYYNKE